MADYATTLYRLVLSCDPSEPMVIGGYGSGYVLPFEDTYKIISSAVFHEPILIIDSGVQLIDKIVRELSQLPRVLPFE